MDKTPSKAALLANESPDASRIEYRSGVSDYIILVPHED